jgi:hypothetical protein
MSTFTDLPVNKIGNHTGETNVFLFFLVFLFWFLGFCFLSHRRIQLDSRTIKIHRKTFVIFNFFPFWRIFAPSIEGQCGELRFLHPTSLDQCENDVPYPYLDHGNQWFPHCASLPSCGNCERICIWWFSLPRPWIWFWGEFLGLIMICLHSTWYFFSCF